ncbi:MAG: phosphoglycerate dehydrogenase [Clostridia bacterium]|nr:phosphoglycerate dehydrogenase [Clostridia bacterium]
MKVLITPRSFGQNSKVPFEMLKENGWTIIKNPYGRILTEEEMEDLIADADGVIIGVDPLNKSVLKAAKKLKVISKYGVGLDNVDLEYAKEKNIKVFNVKNGNSDAVADYAFALMLAVSRKVVLIDRECRKNNWKKIKSLEVCNKTIGIVGLGEIGKGMANRAKGFNMTILAYDVLKDEAYAKENDIQYVELEQLIKESDYITIHLPLLESTKNLFGYEAFEKMKERAVIINTARGGIIEENALYDALTNEKIYGAGIDVFEEEPPRDKRFLELDNIVLGSHCAASSLEAIDNMSIRSVENLFKI